MTHFGSRMAHGFLSASTISAAIANRRPGPGTICMSQNIRFVGPVRPGETVDALMTEKDLNRGKNRAVLSAVCSVGDRALVKGDAIVKTTSSVLRSAKAQKLKIEAQSK